MIFITRGTWKCFITANTFSERMWFAPDWELKPPKVHLKPPPLQCEVSASWFRAQNPPFPLNPLWMYGSVVSVAPKCRRLERLTSVADQLARSPDQPKLPNLVGSNPPKSYQKQKLSPPAPKTLLIRAPACLRACCTRTGIACNSRPDQIAERSFCPFSLWEEKYSLPWRQKVKERVKFSDISWRRQIIAEKIQRQKILAEKKIPGRKIPCR